MVAKLVDNTYAQFYSLARPSWCVGSCMEGVQYLQPRYFVWTNDRWVVAWKVFNTSNPSILCEQMIALTDLAINLFIYGILVKQAE
jgi:hypothetical protein